MTGMLIHSCGPLGTAPPEGTRIISGGKFHRSIVDSSIVEVHKRALDVSFFRVGSKAHLRSTAVREFYTGARRCEPVSDFDIRAPVLSSMDSGGLISRF